MVSEFALQIAKRHCETTQTVGALRLADNADAELQEVREVVDDLADDVCYNSCWQRWGRERGDDEYHSEACQRARALMEKLKI